MREIKFRAYVESDPPIMKFIGLSVDEAFINIINWGNELICNDAFGHGHKIKELMQYTGLKDKNGKEIYEGDLIKYKDKQFEIKYCNGGFKMMETVSMFEGATDGWICEILQKCHCNATTTQIEVIGNIYENPELLKEPQNAN